MNPDPNRPQQRAELLFGSVTKPMLSGSQGDVLEPSNVVQK